MDSSGWDPREEVRGLIEQVSFYFMIRKGEIILRETGRHVSDRAPNSDELHRRTLKEGVERGKTWFSTGGGKT